MEMIAYALGLFCLAVHLWIMLGLIGMSGMQTRKERKEYGVDADL